MKNERLAVPVEARDGEGLAEILYRAAAENGYLSGAAISNALGVHGRLPTGMGSRFTGKEVALASFLGCRDSPERVKEMLYLPIAERRGWQTFFGTSVRQIYRELKRRRVSPIALKASPHIRAIWSIRPLSFDPESKEMLLANCPVCSSPLGWTRSYGVCFCDRCSHVDDRECERGTVDLRDFPQPLVDPSIWDGLDLASGLINPSRNIRASFAPSLPEPLRSFERGELFEFLIALAAAFADPDGSKSCYLSRAIQQRRELDPHVVAKGAFAMLDWPSSIDAALEMVRAGEHERRGHFGKRKAFGAFAQLSIDHAIHPDLRRLILGVLDRHLVSPHTVGRVGKTLPNSTPSHEAPISAAASIFGVSRKRISNIIRKMPGIGHKSADSAKASVLVSIPQLRSILEEERELSSLESAALRLGVPCLAVQSLITAGFFDGRHHSQQALGGGVHTASLDLFIDRLRRRVRVGPPACEMITLQQAAVHLGSPLSNPWPVLMKTVLDGNANAFPGPNACSAASGITISRLSINHLERMADPWPSDRQEHISHQDACRLLAIDPTVLYTLIREGHLPRAMTLFDVQSFAASNVLTPELYRRVRSRGHDVPMRVVARSLRDRGVSPSGSKSRLVWSRSDAEAALDQIFTK